MVHSLFLGILLIATFLVSEYAFASDTLSTPLQQKTEELKPLDDKWMSHPTRVGAPVQLRLTEQERQWLEQNPVIRMAPDPDFPPLEFFDIQGARQAQVHVHRLHVS